MLLSLPACGGGGGEDPKYYAKWKVRDGCDDGKAMYLFFYSTSRGLVSDDYTIFQQQTPVSVELECQSQGETICIGAAEKYYVGNDWWWAEWWGVGPKGDKQCSWDCCNDCSGVIKEFNLTC